MKEKLKKLSKAFEKQAEGLDGIIDALTRTAPVPPIPPVDPSDTIFKFSDGTTAVIIGSTFSRNQETDETNSEFYTSDGVLSKEQLNNVTEIVMGTDSSKLDGFYTIGETYEWERDAFGVRMPNGNMSTMEAIFPNLEKLTINGNWTQSDSTFACFANQGGPDSKYTKLHEIVFNGDFECGGRNCIVADSTQTVTFGGNTDFGYLNPSNGGVVGGYDSGEGPSVTTVNLPQNGIFTRSSGDSGHIFGSNITQITIPAGCDFQIYGPEFDNYSLGEVTFEGRTIAQVQALPGYDQEPNGPWGINTGPHNGKVIHCSDGDITFPPRSDS